MKTEKELRKEYQSYIDIVNQSGEPKDPREAKHLKKYSREAKFIKGCLLYLETNPKFETLKSWLEESERVLDLINDEEKFKSWVFNIKNHKPDDISAGLENEFKAEYEKLMEKSKYRNQVKTLRFLLS